MLFIQGQDTVGGFLREINKSTTWRPICPTCSLISLGLFHWVLIVVVSICIVFPVTFLVTSIQSEIACRSSKPAHKRPPILPYWIPVLGSAPLFMWNGLELCKTLVQKYGHSFPVGVRVGPVVIYIPSSREHIHKLLQAPSGLEANPVVIPASLNWILGMPMSGVSAFEEDNSGSYTKPFPGTNVPVNARIRNANWEPAHRHLNGESSYGMSEHYAQILHRNLLATSQIDAEWVELPDLFTFVKDLVTSTGAEAVCGKALLDLNPTFVEDYWDFECKITSLMYGWPRWLIPGAYRKRDKMLHSVKKWHKHLDAHLKSQEAEGKESEWTKDTGSKYIRARRRAYLALDSTRIDADSTASSDLGIIFAFTSNSSKSIFWIVFEVFSRPALLARVREIIGVFKIYDIRRLSQNALLRSIFSEVLRLRTVGLDPRKLISASKDFEFDGWSIRGDSLLGLSTWHGAMNETIWNQGTEKDPHPIEDFWAERFVIYPDNPSSGPVRKNAQSTTTQGYNNRDETVSKEGVFSTDGLNGVFLPFGGGPGKCPGRDFAKREAISTLSLLVERYEIELRTPKGWQPRMFGGFFPLGVLPPKDKVPFRIKLR